MNVGEHFSHYRILSELGHGGMGMVYEAEDTRLGRRVALKYLSEELSRDPEMIRQFEQEARTASSLNHPNICTIYDFDEHDGHRFIAMELLEGESLLHRIRFDQLATPQMLDLALQVVDALQAAHSRGILHRDIKPANIFITRGGAAKVLDFGLATLLPLIRRASSTAAPRAFSTRSSTEVTSAKTYGGTLAYMSPEQVRGEVLDARSDIFSFGAVLYEMATGRRAFVGDNSAATAEAVEHGEPIKPSVINPDVPPGVEAIIAKCLQKDRVARYAYVADLKTDLEAMKAAATVHQSALAPHPASGRVALPVAAAVAAPAPARARYLFAASAVLLVLVVAIAGVAFWKYRTAHRLTTSDLILVGDFANSTNEPVFDVTLRQALIIDLSQSPFLRTVAPQQVQTTLRFMGRSPDERLVPALAREVCQREGVKAELTGSISSFGQHYLIALEALNCATGDVLSRQQVEASDRDGVLKALSKAAGDLRRDLGESLQSVQKLDTPLEEATTPSLEALKAYSLGQDARARGLSEAEAIPFFEKAIDLDPNFAMAYGRLGAIYENLGENDAAAANLEKAYAHRDRVSEIEKVYISSHYYTSVTGELDKLLETFDVWERMYPLDWTPANNASYAYARLAGRFDRALEQALIAYRREPTSGFVLNVLGQAYLGQGRYPEARKEYEQAIRTGVDAEGVHTGLAKIAFLEGDDAAFARQLQWAAGRPSEYALVEIEADSLAFGGQIRKAQETYQRASQLAQDRKFPDNAAMIASNQAMVEVLCGYRQAAVADANRALALSHNRYPAMFSAFVLAEAGESAKANAVASDAAARFPLDTLLKNVWGPMVQEAIETGRGDPAKAVSLMETARPNDLAMNLEFLPIYVRGEAYLKQRAGADAAREFQQILDHRGANTTSPVYALAWLGLGRALALSGDKQKSSAAFDQFFHAWTKADADVPLLLEARKEYAALH